MRSARRRRPSQTSNTHGKVHSKQRAIPAAWSRARINTLFIFTPQSTDRRRSVGLFHRAETHPRAATSTAQTDTPRRATRSPRNPRCLAGSNEWLLCARASYLFLRETYLSPSDSLDLLCPGAVSARRHSTFLGKAETGY